MGLTTQQVEDLRQVFYLIDTDGKGAITAKELHVVLQGSSQHATLEDAEALIQEIDPVLPNLALENPAAARQIDWQTFKNAMEVRLGQNAGSPAQLFEALDTDGLGLLTPLALKAALLRYGLDSSFGRIDVMMRAVDQNNDGMIGMTEFASFFKRHSGPEAVKTGAGQ